MQEDPIGFDGGINFYVYCANNPINYVDPWGQCQEGEERNVFKIRTLAGGGGGYILGGELTTFEIEHVVTRRRQIYSFVGAGAAFGGRFAGSGASSWTAFHTRKYDLTEQSFYGYAIVTWIGGKFGLGGGVINIDWITGPASGENVAGIGWETGFAGGAQTSHGYMFRR